MSFPWEFLVERWRFNHYQSHRNKRVCRNGSSHFKIEKKSKLILFSGLLKHYNTSHPDYQNTNLAMVKIQSVIRKMSIRLRESVSFFQVFRQIVFQQPDWILQENFVKLAELQRDLGGHDQLLHCEREFLREGCLQKLSRKGYQQRMFFLVSINFHEWLMFWPLRLSTFPVFWLAHLRQPYHDSLAPFSCSRSNVAQRCYSSRQRASLRPRTLFQPLRWKEGRPGGRGYACRKTLLDGRHCWGRTSKKMPFYILRALFNYSFLMKF